MKKVLFVFGALLTLGLLCACSSDDEVAGTDHSSDYGMWETENYDSMYQVNYYSQNPGLDVKQGYWTPNGFIELYPQSTTPYNLLVQWNDEQGKKVIDYILAKNQDMMTKDAYVETSNEYRITSNIYFESPYIYVSSYYKSSEFPNLDRYNVVVLPQIMLKMKEGESVETIIRDYANMLKFGGMISEKLGIYIFDCNLKTSRELLELNAEICQRDDVEYSDFNTYNEPFME